VDDPAGDARGADHGRAAPDGPFCCHAGSAAALVFPPEIASRPGSTMITAVSGRLPPAAPAVGIYRPPAST
jgi:hypothetical protein